MRCLREVAYHNPPGSLADMFLIGLLIRTDRGIRTAMKIEGETVHYDATNPEARQYLWDIAKKNYYDKGVRTFWLDEVRHFTMISEW